jgi:hypothetical protein
MADPYGKTKKEADQFIANTNYFEAISAWEKFVRTYCPGDHDTLHMMANNDERGRACAKLAELYELHPELQEQNYRLEPAYLYKQASEYHNVDGMLNLARIHEKGQYFYNVDYGQAIELYKKVNQVTSSIDITPQIANLTLLKDSKLDACINLLDHDIRNTRYATGKIKIDAVSNLTTNLKKQGHEFIQGRITKEEFATQALDDIRAARKHFEADSSLSVEGALDNIFIGLARAASAILTVLSVGKLNEYFDKSALGLISTRADAMRRLDLADAEISKLLPTEPKNSTEFKNTYQEVKEEDADFLGKPPVPGPDSIK